MKIIIKTKVSGHYKDVIEKFDRKLFERLTPPGAQVKLVRFDGSQKGDIVHLQLKLFGFIEQDWISEIIEANVDESDAYFIDRGQKLPFFLTKWKHRHVVKHLGQNSEIVDDIYFRTPTILTDILLYPVLYLQFVYRKPIYQRYFGKVT